MTTDSDGACGESSSGSASNCGLLRCQIVRSAADRREADWPSAGDGAAQQNRVARKKRKIDLRKRIQKEIIAVEGYHQPFESKNRSLRDCAGARKQLEDRAFDGQHYSDNTCSH